jgi:DNA-binding protein YbaB
VQGKAKQAYDGLEAMLEAVYDWQDEVDALVTTGSVDQDIIATHDSKGRLIELWVRPGVQQELTTEEFEDAINEAIADNAHRGVEKMHEISDRFLARFGAIPEELARHPVAERLARAFSPTADPNTNTTGRNL